MKSPLEEIIRIRVSDIDEFLAGRLIESGVRPLAFSVRDADSGEGAIELREIGTPEGLPEAGGIDFELSSCECGGLGQDDPGMYIGRPVYASSAYELFDYLLGHYSSFDCYIEFTGNAWSVRIQNTARV